MTQPYHWTDDEDDVAMDAVTVSISTKTRILKIGELEFGDPIGWVYWPERVTTESKVSERKEGPYEDVRSALAFAEEIAQLHGFPRVVIALQDRDLWNDSWGLLARSSGLD